MYLPFAIFLLTDIFYFYVLRKRKISITNVFPFIFVGFVNLYTLACYLANILGFASRYKIELLASESIISQYLYNSSIALFIFSLCILFSKMKYNKADDNYEFEANKLFYYICFFIVYPFAYYLAGLANWTTGERSGLVPSLAAYTRNIITVLVITFISMKNLSNTKKFLFMLLYLVITFKSTQRTNFLIVAVAYVYTIKNTKVATRMLVFSVIALLALGSLRNGISVLNIMYPIMGEGIFGSWGTLNAIEQIQKYGFDSTNILYILNPILNFFIEKIGFYLPQVSDVLSSHGIVYYPLGGFFYISDAILAHPYIGTPIYTFFIYLLYKLGYKMYIRKATAESLLYLGLLFEVIKATLTVTTAMFLFHFLFLFLFRLFSKMIYRACKTL